MTVAETDRLALRLEHQLEQIARQLLQLGYTVRDLVELVDLATDEDAS